MFHKTVFQTVKVYLWLQFKHRNGLTLHLVIKHDAELAQLSIQGQRGELLAVSLALFEVYQYGLEAADTPPG